MIEEEYELSECAEQAVNFYWPSSLKPNHPMFEQRMIELQIALMKCHRHTMFPSDKRRTLQTVKELKEKIKTLSVKKATLDTSHNDLDQ
jgi:hypothetical protein